jgi:hypothetical protein
VARLLGALATVSEAAGEVATSALGATTKLTASATDIVVAVATNTLNISQTFWRGIDLYDIKVSRCVGALSVDSSAVLETWLHSVHKHALLPCLQGDIQTSVQAAAASIGLLFPSLRAQNENLNMSGAYNSAIVHATLLFDGKLRVTFDVVQVSFRGQWANPMWATFSFSEELERGQVLAALQVVVFSMPSRVIEWDQDTSTSASFDTWLLLHGRCERLLRSATVQGCSLVPCLAFMTVGGAGLCVQSFFSHTQIV